MISYTVTKIIMLMSVIRSRRTINIDMNMREAILAAAQNDHTEIVSCLLQRNFSLGAKIVESITSMHHSTELSLLSSIFEVMCIYESLRERERPWSHKSMLLTLWISPVSSLHQAV